MWEVMNDNCYKYIACVGSNDQKDEEMEPWQPACPSAMTKTNNMKLWFQRNITGLPEDTVTFSYVACMYFILLSSLAR